MDTTSVALTILRPDRGVLASILDDMLSFVDADGGKARFPNNKAGSKYGTGYCDTQCPQDIKFINGEVCTNPRSFCKQLLTVRVIGQYPWLGGLCERPERRYRPVRYLL